MLSLFHNLFYRNVQEGAEDVSGSPGIKHPIPKNTFKLERCINEKGEESWSLYTQDFSVYLISRRWFSLSHSSSRDWYFCCDSPNKEVLKEMAQEWWDEKVERGLREFKKTGEVEYIT